MSKKNTTFAHKSNTVFPLMKQFSCKNFRKFEELPNMELGGVNILVGPNNAGKSTIAKAMLTFCDFINNLTPDNHFLRFNTPLMKKIRIENYAECINRKRMYDGNLDFTATVDDVCISVGFYKPTSVTGELLKSYEAVANRQWLVWHHFEISDKDGNSVRIKNDPMAGIYAADFSLSKEMFRKKGLPEENVEQIISHLRPRTIETTDEMKELLRQIKSAYLVSSHFVASYLDRLRAIYEKASVELVPQTNSLLSRHRDEVALREMCVLANRCRLLATVARELYTEEPTEEATIKMEDAITTNTMRHSDVIGREKMHAIIRIVKSVFDDYDILLRNLCPKDKRISTIINKYSRALASISDQYSYCSIINIDLAGVYLLDSDNDISEAIREWLPYDRKDVSPEERQKDKYIDWINRWMREFKIGASFDIAYFRNKAVSVDIENLPDNNSRARRSIYPGTMSLDNLGKGAIHTFILLMKIATFARKANRRKTAQVFIEEPELNLHPKYQSLLADMFVDAHKQFELQIFVETHSEYLVRKLQSVVAKKEYEVKPEDIAIFYIYDAADKPKEEPLVKPIKIKENGGLTAGFGTGFFDETYKINMAMLSGK